MFRRSGSSRCAAPIFPSRVDSTEEAERIYALLSDGGEIFMPMQETFFAFRFGMLRDKFGTSWMIIHERPMQPNA